MVMKRFEAANRQKLEYEILIPAINSLVKDRLAGIEQVPKEVYASAPEIISQYFSEKGASPEIKELLTNMVVFCWNTIKRIESAKSMDEIVSALGDAYRVIADFSMSKETVENFCREIDKELWTTDFTRGLMGELKAKKKAPEGSRLGDGRRGVCEYHACNKDTQVYSCKYCNKLYCKDHFNPKPMRVPDIQPNTEEERKIIAQWKSEEGHACPEFHDESRKLIDAEEERHEKALENLLYRAAAGEKPLEEASAESPDVPVRKVKRRRLSDVSLEPEPQQLDSRKVMIGVLVVIVVIVFSLFSVFFYNQVFSRSETPAVTTTTTSTTSTSTITTSSTSTTIKVSPPAGCWSYCEKLNSTYMGACMKNRNVCKNFAWIYDKGGNHLCPRTASGVETFCCCGSNSKFLTLLDDETIPRKGDPQIQEYLTSKG